MLHVRADAPGPGVKIGKLGSFDFPPGHYLYAGSALNSLWPRLRRHFTPGGRAHWHIDHLLRRTTASAAWVALTDRRLECELARSIGSLAGASRWPPGFGSSDCRCGGHLFAFTVPPPVESVAAAFARVGLECRIVGPADFTAPRCSDNGRSPIPAEGGRQA